MNAYGTELARLYPEFKQFMSYEEQYSLMRDACRNAGAKFNCWTGGKRDPDDDDIWRF